ncbi:MAG: alkaline phosphatase [Proteobacteria bacterium]|nr:alkaline phosphatase [Pseudomonadota bacterium]
MISRLGSLTLLGLVACAADPAPPPVAIARLAPTAPPPVAVPAPVPEPPRPVVAPPPTHVVIISIDGLRPDMMTPALMPRHVQLMAEGTTARHASTILQSDTLPSHAAMLSGVGAAAHGLWWNSYQANRGFIKVPTVFSAARDRGLSTAMIVGKQKLRHIAGPTTVDHFERPSYLCGGVAKRASAYFTEVTPVLLFVLFSDPDEYGHSHGWQSPEYARAAKNSDACLATVLAAIDASPVGPRTLVIVTADHGGHGKVHSDGRSEENSHIPWIARGPGVAAGATIDEPIATVDTAATTLAALGLAPLPHMRGEARLKFAAHAPIP